MHSGDRLVVSVEQVIPASEAREQVYEKNVDVTQVQHCVKESDTEMDILQSPQTDFLVKSKGMKLKIKKSKSEPEQQEKTVSIAEKTDGMSIGICCFPSISIHIETHPCVLQRRQIYVCFGETPRCIYCEI